MDGLTIIVCIIWTLNNEMQKYRNTDNTLRSEVMSNMNSSNKVKRARNKVETKLLLFGPNNITSMTYAAKLQDIATTAEPYLEGSEEKLQDLEKKKIKLKIFQSKKKT